MGKTTYTTGDKRIRHGLTIGAKLPSGAGYIVRTTGQFRAELEAAVAALKGEVSLVDAATIQSAVRWERHALLCQRWLVKEAATLTAAERLAYSTAIAKASSERDKCLDRLALRRDKVQDMFDALYSTPLPPIEHSHAPATADASTATPERLAADSSSIPPTQED